MKILFEEVLHTFTHKPLGSVDLSRLNLQQSIWYLDKAEPM